MMILALLLAATAAPISVTSVVLNPESVIGGTAVEGIVTLSRAADAHGVTVTLASSTPAVAEVPRKLTIAEGETYTRFTVQTHPAAHRGGEGVQISAHAPGTRVAAAHLTVYAPMLAALTLDPTTIAGGNKATATVTLNGPAPSSGLVIALRPPSVELLRPSSQSLASMLADIQYPSTVTIAGGASSANFTITTKAVPAQRLYGIEAKLGGTVKSATLTVTP
jgi:hypothetical protein